MGADSNLPGQSKSSSWWTTLPGVLTAVAGTVTAVAGLIVALHQAGVLGGSRKPAAEKPPAVRSERAGNTAEPEQGGSRSSAGGQAAAGVVSFPSGNEVQAGEGKDRVLFKVLSARLEARGGDALALRLKLRVTNHTRFPVYCGSSLRLLVDGAPQSPADVSHLDTPIDSVSSREADVIFDLSGSARRVAFMVLDPRNNSGGGYKLPLDLSLPKP